uniref:Cytochrome P450 302a1, mitochondrial n=1 Tax=Cacopsylla melanoneura TaxID=428564 RepID=A0A8D8VTC2_9HEMI
MRRTCQRLALSCPGSTRATGTKADFSTPNTGTKADFSTPNTGTKANLSTPNTRNQAVKSFEEIPGPKSLPFVGTLHKYLPLIGEYQFDRLHWNGLAKYRQYGPLVKEEIVPGVHLVWVFRPEDIETVFKSEGRYPERRSHLALEKYRLDHPEVYSTGGLLPTNGEEWWRIRSELQKGLSEIKHVRSNLDNVNNVMDEFMDLRIGHQATFQDFLPELERLYLELMCLTAFEERLGSFSDAQIQPESLSSKLIDAAMTANSCILKTDNGPQLWRKFDTPLYRKFKLAHGFLEEQAVRFVRQKSSSLETNSRCPSLHKSNSLLENYLTNPNLGLKDVVGMGVDFLLAGIDTSAYSSCFLLYYLSTNQQVQDKLFGQMSQLSGKTVTSADYDACSYAKAVIKESFRMAPISVGVGRTLGKHAVLNGYHVPAGTFTVTQNQVSCRLPEYFPEPDTFVPERWFREDQTVDKKSVSPYLVLPFGHGPRTCIARRSAEQNLQVLIMKLVNRYHIKWHGGTLDSKSLLINRPDQPVALEFIARK